MLSIRDLPAVNASLNLVSAVFISMGWYLIRNGAWRRHMASMITEVVSSTFFLVGYIVYHAHVREKSTHLAAGGLNARIYYPTLISHVRLPFLTLSLAILTLVQVFSPH